MMPKVKVSVALEGRGGLTGAGKKLVRESIDPATTPLRATYLTRINFKQKTGS